MFLSGIIDLGISLSFFAMGWILWRARLFREVPREVKVMMSVGLLMLFMLFTVSAVVIFVFSFAQPLGSQ